jgi:hypothetical protein
MPNIQVKRAITHISNDLDALAKHIDLYSGIGPNQGRFVESVARDIMETATKIAELARQVQKAST